LCGRKGFWPVKPAPFIYIDNLLEQFMMNTKGNWSDQVYLETTPILQPVFQDNLGKLAPERQNHCGCQGTRDDGWQWQDTASI